MPIIPLALPRQSEKGQEPHAGAARLVNGFARPVELEGRTQMQVWARPGLDSLATLGGTGGVRAMQEVDGTLYVVAGRIIHRAEAGGANSIIGGLPSDGFVGKARNSRGTGPQICFTCDGLAVLVENGVLSSITTLSISPIDVCCIDRYFVFIDSRGRMQSSDIDSGQVYDGLDVAEAESNPDGGLRVVDRGRDLIVFGPRSFEVWADTAADAFPFTRQHAVSVGALSAGSVVKATIIQKGGAVSDTVAWAGTNHEGKFSGVMLLNGYTPTPISTAAVNRDFADVADPTTIAASSYVNESGEAFIRWRLPSTTWVYCTNTGLWHEEASRDSLGNEITSNIAHMATLGYRTVAGHADEPQLYWVDTDYQDDDGDELVMTVQTPPAHATPERLTMDALYLDIVPGVGLASGSTEDTDPEVMMQFSSDGETWSNELRRAIGAQGARQTRAKWTRLGTTSHTGRTYRFRVSANVAKGLLGAKWEGGKARA